jgi:hypothetical protein
MAALLHDAWRQRERPLAAVPRAVVLILLIALAAQIIWRVASPEPRAAAVDLPRPPSAAVLRLFSFGDPVTLARLLTFWLQAFDNQPGVSIPFRQLDYERVAQWLDRILELDPAADYPLLAAARVYAEVNDPARQRVMLEFVYRKFMEDPDRRWPWLAHAVYVAKHRLQDLPLARGYARALARHASAHAVPHWARQLEIYVLEDMGEIEAARILIGGLLESGEITDAHELKFLEERLRRLEEGLSRAQLGTLTP